MTFKFLVLINTVLILVCFPLLVLLLSPLLLFRWIVSILARCFKPNLIRILSLGSSMQTVVLNGRNEVRNLVISYTIQGELDEGDFVSRVEQMLATKKSNGDLLYPEFQMKIDWWIHYPFWALEKDFNLQDHIGRTSAAEDGLENIKFEYLRTPLPPDKSPWSILLVEMEEEWVFLFKFHHSLADGYAIFNALMRLADDDSIPRYVAPSPKQSGFAHRFVRGITFPFRAAYDLASELADSPLAAQHPIRFKTKDMSPDSRHLALSHPILCQDVKAISKAHKVSFTSALLAGISGGVNGWAGKRGLELPSDMWITMPIPIPKHSPGLTNEFTAIFIKLPTGVQDGVKRVQLVEERLNAVKGSTLPIRLYWLNELGGALPRWFIPMLLPSALLPLQISNFPGPGREVLINGHPITDMHYTVWSAGGDSLFMGVVSYNGQIRIHCSGEPQLFVDGVSANDLMEEIGAEIKRLLGGIDAVANR